MKILDCTLRDGGYYTNWDFDDNIVETYLDETNNLPVNYIEIGYRSNLLSGYFGRFYYSPAYLIKYIRKVNNKKISIMINERDIDPKNVVTLLSPLKGLIDMVRVAIHPANFEKTVNIAEVIKKMNFEVAFNVMYMSKWSTDPSFLSNVNEVDGVLDYIYMVDSYGGVYPEDVRKSIELIKQKSSVKIGFHGHNNLELAFINTLTAIECGVDMVDATMTGMGRGAGNLKTELLLTVLKQKGILEVDFNSLSKVVDQFMALQNKYQWGTSLPYMVSGANSLPNKNVMEWVSKRYYSFNTIIRALKNQSDGVDDNLKLEDFKPNGRVNKVLIVGGGLTGTDHATAIKHFLSSQPEIVVIHASSKNAHAYSSISNRQIHCLVGNEGFRLESFFKDLDVNNRIAILPPYPRVMGTYIPICFAEKSYQLKNISFSEKFRDAITVIAIQTAFDLGSNEIYFVGYDGYSDDVDKNLLELFNENEAIFLELKKTNVKFMSLTPSKYSELPMSSVYAYL